MASSYLYGGTYNQFKVTLPRLGINVRFVESTDPEALEAAITERTKAVFVESIANPEFLVPDLEAVADVAHRRTLSGDEATARDVPAGSAGRCSHEPGGGPDRSTRRTA